VRGPSAGAAGGFDKGAPPADILQPPDPTAFVATDPDVAVHWAEVPRPPLLQGLEHGGG
jgi:hypothetical protein